MKRVNCGGLGEVAFGDTRFGCRQVLTDKYIVFHDFLLVVLEPNSVLFSTMKHSVVPASKFIDKGALLLRVITPGGALPIMLRSKPSKSGSYERARSVLCSSCSSKWIVDFMGNSAAKAKSGENKNKYKSSTINEAASDARSRDCKMLNCMATACPPGAIARDVVDLALSFGSADERS